MLPELPNPELGTDPGPYVALLVIGFLVGVVGHLTTSKTIVAIGVMLIFLATVALPFVAAVSR